MPSLTITACAFDAMEQRILHDARLTELVCMTVSAIMTECYPGVTEHTPELTQRAMKLQDMIITAFALMDAETWPSRHIGAA